MARNPIAHRVIHELCGGVAAFAAATGQKQQSVRNYLTRGFPYSETMNGILKCLTDAGFDVKPDDFFNQPYLPQQKESQDHDQEITQGSYRESARAVEESRF